MPQHVVATLPACVAMLYVLLPSAACDSRRATSPAIPPTPLPPPSAVTRTLSGQVFEVTPGGRIPAADIRVNITVITGNCPAPVCTSHFIYDGTTTGPNGRYSFPDLPAGLVVVRANSATHRQLCGALAELDQTTRMDLEITSRANPQPSPTMPPLKVTGQVFETTPAGRVGVGGALVIFEWYYEVTVLNIDADADGRYEACGIPANRPIAVGAWQEGFESPYARHQFSADTTLDLELKRQ